MRCSPAVTVGSLVLGEFIPVPSLTLLDAAWLKTRESPKKRLNPPPVFSKKDAIGNLMQSQKSIQNRSVFFPPCRGQDEVGKEVVSRAWARPFNQAS